MRQGGRTGTVSFFRDWSQTLQKMPVSQQNGIREERRQLEIHSYSGKYYFLNPQ